MVAASVTSGLRCGDCHRLYAYLDRRQGGRAWAVKGAGEVAKGLSWQSRTAKKHLRHLADVGLIELDPEPAPAWGNTLVRVVHAPARRRYADPRSQPGVWEPEPDARWRKPAKTAAEIERLRANGWRSAPTVRPDHAATPEAVFERPRPLRTVGAARPPEAVEGRRDPPPREARRATRTNSDGGRGAPTVPVSRYEVGSRAGFRERGGKGLDGPASEVSAIARLEEAFGPVEVVDEARALCAACGLPADGQPDPSGTPMCRTHEPF